MAVVVQVLAATVVVMLMFVVGLSVSTASLGRLLGRPGPMAFLLLGQILLVPLVGVVVALALGALVGDSSNEGGTSVAVWLVLLASAPGGAISNALVLYGRGDVALSVAMTTVSSLLAAFSMPVVLRVCEAWGLLPATTPPGSEVFLTVLLLLLAPCVAGMLARWRSPQAASRLGTVTGRLGTSVLIVALLVGVWHRRDVVAETWTLAALAAGGFVLVGAATGSLLARTIRLDADGRFAVATEFGVRNIAAALAVSALSFGDDGFAGFGAIYLAVEVGLLAIRGHVRRRSRGPLPAEVSAETASSRE